VRLHNRYDFLSLDHLCCAWSVSADGQVVRSGSAEVPVVRPGGTRVMEVPIGDAPALPPGAECRLNLSFTLGGDTPWAERGHEVAWAQLDLPWETPEAPVVSRSAMGRVDCEEAGDELRVFGGDFDLVFDRTLGRLTSWRRNGTELLVAGPRMNFWRSPTDNDARVADQWREAGLEAMQHRADSVEWEPAGDGRGTVVRIRSRVAPPVHERAFLCDYTYLIYGSGDLILRVHCTPEGEFPVLPRIGLQMSVPHDLRQVDWYGRGPGESYPDSKQAGRIGRYCATVEALHTPYVFPQENGNRTDVRWVSLMDRRGQGLLAAGMPLVNFSAHPYRDEDLDAADHTVELETRPEITLNLDYRQRPLGTQSCGPGPLTKYELHAHEFDFAVRLRPCSTDEASARSLARQRLEEPGESQSKRVR
jgi:beta-galactosidase/evolved beta-galactosidase subunit alpha